jgi:hypothetical protein
MEREEEIILSNSPTYWILIEEQCITQKWHYLCLRYFYLSYFSSRMSSNIGRKRMEQTEAETPNQGIVSQIE